MISLSLNPLPRRCPVSDSHPGGANPTPKRSASAREKPPLAEEAPPLLRARGQQPLGVELRRGLVRVDQPLPLALLVARDVAALLVAQLDPRAPGEALHRLDEAQVLDLLHERDDVAALGATEAVEQAARGGDVEGRGLLVVEGAQALQGAAAGVAELEVLPHHVGDG